MASLQKNGQTNIVKPSWLIDCIKQNEKDAGLPDLLLPFEPKYAFTGPTAFETAAYLVPIYTGTCSSSWKTETTKSLSMQTPSGTVTLGTLMWTS